MTYYENRVWPDPASEVRFVIDEDSYWNIRGDEMFDVFYIHHPENEDDPPFQLVASRKEYYGSTTVWIQWGEPNE